MTFNSSETDVLMAKRFASLGSEQRLGLLRVLVRAGDTGLTVGQIQQATGMAASTQFHHMSLLVDAALVKRERRGKEVVHSVRFSELKAIGDYLMQDCCAGMP
jgi:ArsR family transcriptional regulator